jgi:hypothetical protein
MFDVILSRHEAVEPAEVDRVLVPGGIFLTQQVMPDNWPELTRFFPRKTIHPDHFTSYYETFLDLGYRVSRRQHDLRTAFSTLGDLVMNLLACPWEVPNLDIERDAEALLTLESTLSTPDGIVVTEGRYLLEAQKVGH